MKTTQWKKIKCHDCSGHGMVSVYSVLDFEGAGECATCGGKGHLFASPSGTLVEYPGGPLRGKLSKLELVNSG